MILDNLSIPARIKMFGWPWHGVLQRPKVLAPERLVMPDRTLLSKDGTSGGDERAWRFTAWSPDTYLWAPGIEDVDDPEIEAKGGKWLGKAILRGNPRIGGNADLMAYGYSFVSRTKSGTFFGQIGVWPIWLDGKKCRAALVGYNFPLKVRLFLDDTIGTETPEVDIDLADIDVAQVSPDVYINDIKAERYYFKGPLDMTPDGRSALIPIYSATPIESSTPGEMLTGLMRLDITGGGGEFSAALSLVMGRAEAAGELVNEETGGFTDRTLYYPPAEVTGGSPWPGCSNLVSTRKAQFIPKPDGATGSPYRGLDGVETKLSGRRGVLYSAWFGKGGEPEFVRYDSEELQTSDNSRSDESAGEYKRIEERISGPTTCELGAITITDDTNLKLTGHTFYSIKHTIKVHGPAGEIVQQIHEFTSDTNCEVGTDTGFLLEGTEVVQFKVNGAVLAEETRTSLPVSAFGLVASFPIPFGSTNIGPPAKREFNLWRRNSSAQTMRIGADVGVVAGSNKAVMAAEFTTFYDVSPDIKTATSGVITPAGLIDEEQSDDVRFTEPPFTLENSEAKRFYQCSYNPVTDAIARAWPDYLTVSWV